MTVTTSYGNWTIVEEFSVSVEDTIGAALGAFAGDYNTDAIAADYRAAINAALPDGVSLCGDEFYGPAYADELPDIKDIVEGIDFWAIAARHDTTATNQGDQGMTKFVATLANFSHVVAGDNCDVSVNECEIVTYDEGVDGDVIPVYEMTSTLAMDTTETTVPTDGDIGAALAEADTILRDAGWIRVSDWEAGENAYYADVERDA